MRQSTVTVRIIGGLGNQMFQYAAALALARRTGARLMLDLSAFRNYTLHDYGLGHWRISCGPGDVRAEILPLRLEARYGLRLPVRLWRRQRGLFAFPWRSLQLPQYYREPFFPCDAVGWRNLTPPVYLDGFFQSPLYFDEIADTIRQEFQLTAPLPATAEAFTKQIGALSCPVAVHVRRGDYASDPHTTAKHGLLGAEYYTAALALMDRLTDGAAQYVVFSDDPDAALPLFQGRQVLSVRHPAPVLPHADLTLMQTCRHHIIANSSFSWWGAWLNPRPDKQVITPRLWFNRAILRTHPVHDLLPAGWIQI
jgi:hypothetical protein